MHMYHFSHLNKQINVQKSNCKKNIGVKPVQLYTFKRLMST